MEIKTKANTGDTIWYLLKSSVCSSAVQHISIHAAREDEYQMNIKSGYVDNIKILYTTSHGEINDTDIYMSREELGKAILEGAL